MGYVYWAGDELRRDGTILTKGLRGFLVEGADNKWTVKFPGMGMLRNTQRRSLQLLSRSEVLELFVATAEAGTSDLDRLKEVVAAAEAIGIEEEVLERVRPRLAELEAAFQVKLEAWRRENNIR